MKFSHIIYLVLILSLLLGCQKKEEAAPPEKPIAEIVNVEPFHYVCVPFKGDYANHEMVIGQLMQAIGEQQITPAGPMLGIYFNSPMENPPEELIWEVGFPIGEELTVSEPLVAKKWEFTKIAKAMYVGPFEKVDSMYPQIFQCLEKQKMTPAGPTMERFLSDPATTAPDSLLTEIWIPVSEISE